MWLNLASDLWGPRVDAALLGIGDSSGGLNMQHEALCGS